MPIFPWYVRDHLSLSRTSFKWYAIEALYPLTLEPLIQVKGGETVEDAYIIAGETEEGVTNEVWRWHQSENQWFKDYGENADSGT